MFSGILSTRFIIDTGLATIAGGAAYAVHCTTEADGAVGLVFFEEAAGAGAEVVSAVIPATTLDDAGLVADERGLTIAISDTGDRGVTIEVVDDITFLIVTAGSAFRVGDITHLDTAKAIAVGLPSLP